MKVQVNRTCSLQKLTSYCVCDAVAFWGSLLYVALFDMQDDGCVGSAEVRHGRMRWLVAALTHSGKCRLGSCIRASRTSSSFATTPYRAQHHQDRPLAPLHSSNPRSASVCSRWRRRKSPPRFRYAPPFLGLLSLHQHPSTATYPKPHSGLLTACIEVHSPTDRHLCGNQQAFRARPQALDRYPHEPAIPQPSPRRSRPCYLRRSSNPSRRRHRREPLLEA